MTLIPIESERFDNMEKVADLKMHGMNDTQIGKQLGIPRKEVINLFNEYKDALSNDSEARDLARDHLYQMVKHYDHLIAKFYDLVDDIDALNFSHQVAAQKNAALKAIAELDAKRLEALQKAGLLDSAELGDELADMEEKQQMILEILQNDLCVDCQQKISTKMMKLLGRVPTIDVEVVNE